MWPLSFQGLVAGPALWASLSQTSGYSRVMGELVKLQNPKPTLGGNNLRGPEAAFRKPAAGGMCNVL